MPSIIRLNAVAAGATNNNLIEGSAFEYMRAPGIVSAAVSANATDVFLTITSGPDVILEEANCPQGAATWPVIPDNFYFNWGAAQGDRLVFRVRNAGAGSVNVICVVNVQYTR